MEAQSPSSESKLAAALRELEAERARRRQADGGNWWPAMEVRIVDAGMLSTDEAANFPPWPHEYPPEVLELHVINPPPIVQTPSALGDGDHVGARDVTPPRRPSMPMPAASPRPAPPPESYSNAGIPARVHVKALRQLREFESDIYNPEHAPIAYRKPPHGGW